MPLDPSTLTAFENAAAGHDGVLSDPTGALVIKPCTAQEIAFYESATASHPRFAQYMPTFMGTLQLNKGDEAKELAAAVSEKPAATGTAATLASNDPGPLKGKKLDTDTSIVLENAAAGFARPNVLDLKLGARLWDDGTAEAKRARLDKVAAETTSSSLGFRIAGMRVWQGEGQSKTEEELSAVDPESGYKTFNKMYGRTFSADNVATGFREYLLVPSAGVTPASARKTVNRFLADVRGVQAMLEAEESRMYSASLLFVYEGDPAAARSAEEKLAAKERAELDALQDVQMDDGEDEDEEPKLASVKLIDFAHASWTPGQGPDENALRGVRAIVNVLEELEKELAGKE
ncbi:putative inositol polyphosphate multikinase [Phyllosticta capitalensis]